LRTPRISRPQNSGAWSRVSASIVTPMGQSNAPSIAGSGAGFSRPIPRAARSRATPRTPSASPRLGVMAISITGSTRAGSCAASQSAKLSPTAPEGSSMMPSCSSDSFSSRSEAIMPWLSTPRIRPTSIVVSMPGT